MMKLYFLNSIDVIRLSSVIVAFFLISMIAGCGASQEEITIGAMSHFKRGNDRMSQNNPKAAITEYQMAIELDEEQSEYHYNMGLAYYQLLLFDRAADAYRIAVRLNPEFTEAWYNLALSYDKLGDSEKAFMAHDTYLKLNQKPKAPETPPTATP